MTQLAGQKYAAALRGRYGIATKKEKSGILDEFCRVTGCHRKAAIRILRRHRRTPTYSLLDAHIPFGAERVCSE
ncbi:MAG: hypothetical protein IH856_16760 [Deltaproteobacteria bacterium]|nr:hypothetical protein [Deltaproteobacteria bacterium]